jgi:CBS domain-containing protein
MKKVADILARKDRELISVAPAHTVLDALKIMSDNNIGSILVQENDRYMGIMTERDYARKVILKGKSSTDTIVGDIMSTDLPRISPASSIEECMQLMSVNNIRYLPVFDGDHLTGIISVNDVIKAVIANQAETISHLQTYIHSQ